MNRSDFDTIKDLLRKYLQQDLLPHEQQQLDAWVQASPENQSFFERLSRDNNFERELRQFVHSREKILSSLYRQIPELENSRAAITASPAPDGRVVSIRWRRWAAAASVVLLLGAGAYYWTSRKAMHPVAAVAILPKDVPPGKNGAVLTLGDGSQVVLDTLGDQVIATQNGAKVVLANGGLTYAPSGAAHGKVVYNTMTTPRGRQFQLVLPDGTGVWLNAASSITYPTAFTGKERRVSVTGEVYLEVAKNAQMPFRVNIPGDEVIQVLGTSFNVNAYPNEQCINTTLLEGSVRLTHNMDAGHPGTGHDISVVLKPGEQAQSTREGMSIVAHANLDKAVAWKNGIFNFEGARLEEVMRQLERWYDIEVVYENGVPDIEFGGKITKGVSLAGLLVMMKRADVHFRQEGRTLIIMQ